MVSLRKIADSTPDTPITSASNRRGVVAKRVTRAVTTSKKPASRRFTFNTIIANNSTIVLPSTAANARSSGIVPSAIRMVAPTSAMVARFMRSHG